MAMVIVFRGAPARRIEKYVYAWRTYEAADAEYHERPYETAWIGREHADWQAGG